MRSEQVLYRRQQPSTGGIILITRFEDKQYIRSLRGADRLPNVGESINITDAPDAELREFIGTAHVADPSAPPPAPAPQWQTPNWNAFGGRFRY